MIIAIPIIPFVFMLLILSLSSYLGYRIGIFGILYFFSFILIGSVAAIITLRSVSSDSLSGLYIPLLNAFYKKNGLSNTDYIDKNSIFLMTTLLAVVIFIVWLFALVLYLTFFKKVITSSFSSRVEPITLQKGTISRRYTEKQQIYGLLLGFYIGLVYGSIIIFPLTHVFFKANTYNWFTSMINVFTKPGTFGLGVNV